MCVKEFLGFICGHCSIPKLTKCPISLQVDSYPACAIPAEHPAWVNDYCPACRRVVWNDYVLAQEKEHKAQHERRQCHCSTDFNLQRDYPLMHNAQLPRQTQYHHALELRSGQNSTDYWPESQGSHGDAQHQSANAQGHPYPATEAPTYQQPNYTPSELQRNEQHGHMTGGGAMQRNFGEVSNHAGVSNKSSGAGLQAWEPGYDFHQSEVLTQQPARSLSPVAGNPQEYKYAAANPHEQAHWSEESYSVEDYCPQKYGLCNVAGGMRYYPINCDHKEIGQRSSGHTSTSMNHGRHRPHLHQGRGNRRGIPDLAARSTMISKGREGRSSRSSTGPEKDNQFQLYTAGSQVSKGDKEFKAQKPANTSRALSNTYFSLPIIKSEDEQGLNDGDCRDKNYQPAVAWNSMLPRGFSRNSV